MVAVVLVAAEVADQILAAAAVEGLEARGREPRRGGREENPGLRLPHRLADWRWRVEAGGTQYWVRSDGRRRAGMTHRGVRSDWRRELEFRVLGEDDDLLLVKREDGNAPVHA